MLSEAYRYRWPLRWRDALLLFAVAAFMFLLAFFTSELPVFIDAIFGALGVLSLAGVIAALLQTVVVVDRQGVILLRHELFGLVFITRRFSSKELVHLELRVIPIRVAPGRHPRNTHALWLIHPLGAQPIHQDDDRRVVEGPAEKLAEICACPLLTVQMGKNPA